MPLNRSIGLTGLTFVAVSGIIGSGWLFAPLLTSQLAGPSSVVAWLIGGVAMLILALCFAEATSVMPVAGGIARLPHFTHGDVTSSVLGWSAWVGYNTAAPIETIAMLEYLDWQFPWMFLGSPQKGALSLSGCCVAMVVLVCFVGINALGAAIFAKANIWITWVKLIVPVVIGSVILFTQFEPGNFVHGGFAPFGIEGIFAAVSTGGVIFALIGFRHAIDLAGEVRRPHITIPLALTIALIICVGIYVLLQVAFIGALQPKQLEGGWAKIQFDDDLGPMAAIAIGLGIGWANTLLYSGAVIAPFGGGLVSTGSMARLTYALSQNGFFPKYFEQLSKRGVATRALFMNLLFGALIVFLVSFEEAIAINSAAITLSFCAGPLSVYAFRVHLPDASRPFKLPCVGLVARLGFIVATLVVYWSGWDTTWRLGLVVIVGMIFFLIKKLMIDRVSWSKLDVRESCWLLPYGAGIGGISYLGNFEGRGILASPWDLVAVVVLSLIVFEIAYRCRLSNEVAEQYRAEYSTPPPPDTTPL